MLDAIITDLLVRTSLDSFDRICIVIPSIVDISTFFCLGFIVGIVVAVRMVVSYTAVWVFFCITLLIIDFGNYVQVAVFLKAGQIDCSTLACSLLIRL